MALRLQVLEEYLNLEYSEKYILLLLTERFELYYDFERNMLFKNTTDPAILSARLYETVRLKNYNICVPVDWHFIYGQFMNEKNYDDKYPLVSVIVLVRNGEKTIEKLLAALQKQDYPHNSIQIIIVNNGSQDNTIGIIKKYPVILEHEKEKAGSYAARNKGILVASGEVIAFTDVDCIPEKSWINKGVRALYKERADIAGGRIKFTFSARKSAAECFDSLNSLRNNRFIYNKLGLSLPICLSERFV